MFSTKVENESVDKTSKQESVEQAINESIKEDEDFFMP